MKYTNKHLHVLFDGLMRELVVHALEKFECVVHAM